MSRATFDVTPVARPRMTQRDKWKRRPVVLAYFGYRDRLALEAQRQKWEPSAPIRLLFVLPMPASWSKAKKARHAGQPHEQRPDLDNLVKGFLDGFGEDKAVWRLEAEKRWAGEDEGGRVEAVNVEPRARAGGMG